MIKTNLLLVIAISAKLAVDGKFQRVKFYLLKIFDFPAEDEKAISDIFNQLKKILMTIRILLNRFIKHSNLIELLFELLNSLFSIAYADGELHPKEKVMLFEISKFLNFY